MHQVVDGHTLLPVSTTPVEAHRSSDPRPRRATFHQGPRAEGAPATMMMMMMMMMRDPDFHIIHTYIYIYVCVCVRMKNIYIYTYIHTYIHTCICTFLFAQYFPMVYLPLHLFSGTSPWMAPRWLFNASPSWSASATGPSPPNTCNHPGGRQTWHLGCQNMRISWGCEHEKVGIELIDFDLKHENVRKPECD